MTEDQRLEMAGSTSPPARFAARILDFYFARYTAVYGHRSCACHDVVAAAVAARDVVPKRAMTVAVTVDTGYGPARGATICDMRGQYRQELAQPGASCTVVLETGGDLAAAVVRRLTQPL